MLAIIQLAGICVITYFLILGVVMLFMQCPAGEAQKMIASWIQENVSGSQKTDNDSILDYGLIEEIWTNIRLVLGEAQYNQLFQLAVLGTTLFSMNYHSGLPCILISLNYTNDSDKRRIQTALTNVINQRLIPPEYDTRVLVDWTRRNDLDMAVLEIRYAKTEGQRKIMDNVFARSRTKIIAKSAAVIDDTEGVDLF